MRANGRRVPDLIVGGAPRSGTTLACEILARHPDIHVLRPFMPEPKVCLIDLGPEDGAYLDRYDALLTNAPEGACWVEKTSNYWENSGARKRLASILPHTRFVFILREPVSRAYSNWRWSRQNGLETLALAEAINRPDRPSPLPPRQAHARPFDYITRSEYGRLAAEWIEAIGRDRIRFFLFEQAIADLSAWAAELFIYAGVGALPGDIGEVGMINATKDQSPIDAGIERELRARLRPEVLRFAALTGVDVSPWGY